MLAPMDARWTGTQSTIVRRRFHCRQSRETRTGIRGLMNPFERGRWRWLPLVLGFLAAPSQAQPGANPASPTPPPPPVPYSLPWQLRPAAVANTLRLDTSIGFWEDAAGRAGDTWVSGLIATRKVTNRVALLGRVSYIDNHPPSPAQEKAGTAVSNPLLGATFLRSQPGGRRQTLFLAATAPIGSGGGESPRAAQTAALSRAIATRSAMDNALFAVNYFTLIGGASLARVTRGSTLQAEATMLQLFRVRGPKSQDGKRTNFTAGVHLGRSFRPKVSAGLELRYQRWLTDAAPARVDPRAKETMTLAFGTRFHFKLGGSKWVRPGLSFSIPLDQPLSGQRYRILQVDVPVSF